MKIEEIIKDGSYIDEFLELLNYCFGTKEDKMRVKIDSMFEDTDTFIIGAIDSDKLKSSLVVYDYKMFWNNLSIRMGGIASVSSFPEAREDHFVAKLMTESLIRMHDLGIAFSLLAPFSYSFYRKYGWEWGFTSTKYDIDINDLSHISSHGYSMRPVIEEDINSLMKVYYNHYHKINGPIDRSKSHWTLQFKKNQDNKRYSYAVTDTDNSIVGYIIYELKDRVFKIHEMVYVSFEVKEQLLHFAYVHRAQVDRIEVTLPEYDLFLSMLKNQKQNPTIIPGMMFRVIDVEAVLKLYDYFFEGNQTFTIKIEDKYALWNNGVFEVQLEGENPRVNQCHNDKVADVQCTIQTFSQVAFGFRSIAEVDELGLLIYKDKDIVQRLNKLMPKRYMYLADHF